MTSSDLSPTWEAYVISLGFGFHQWDINDGQLLAKARPGEGPTRLRHHFVYVMIYVTNDKVLDMLKDLLLKDGVRAIIMSERSEATAACGFFLMEKRGIHCSRLMSQTLGRDASGSASSCRIVPSSSRHQRATCLSTPLLKMYHSASTRRRGRKKEKSLIASIS